jgi:hypothetical protein
MLRRENLKSSSCFLAKEGEIIYIDYDMSAESQDSRTRRDVCC